MAKYNPLDHVMGVQEASELWGYHIDSIKRLCREGKVKSKLVGNTYVLVRNQDNPRLKQDELKAN